MPQNQYYILFNEAFATFISCCHFSRFSMPFPGVLPLENCSIVTITTPSTKGLTKTSKTGKFKYISIDYEFINFNVIFIVPN